MAKEKKGKQKENINEDEVQKKTKENCTRLSEGKEENK